MTAAADLTEIAVMNSTEAGVSPAVIEQSEPAACGSTIRPFTSDCPTE
ncbi:hypothetical protein RCH21_002711 [Arthrobacter sp. PL16]|nr:hypothetical protein [Arthrobacter sp. PL16]